ncbi:redoxin domain-containing protein [Shivajiella indica]|uniref:Redoxin domain-containing protein n=1 Tax=Shivajiella indica TaxID=872115 RepID=A0ABW5BBH1_9BACT
MKNLIAVLILSALYFSTAFGQKVEDFKLVDALSGKDFFLSDHNQSKGIVLIFTSLNCPFSKLYEERIVQLHDSFSGQGFVFAMINPHVAVEEEEQAAHIKERAAERNIAFAFLMDDKQVVAKQLGITKLPEVVLITPSPTGHSIAYRGAIDNNPQVAANANIKYLENALNAVQNRRNPSPSSSRPVGCNLRSIDL